jgi:hypothetical protein
MEAAILDFQHRLLVMLQEDFEAVISRPLGWISDHFSIFGNFSKLFFACFFSLTRRKTFVKIQKWVKSKIEDICIVGNEKIFHSRPLAPSLKSNSSHNPA